MRGDLLVSRLSAEEADMVSRNDNEMERQLQYSIGDGRRIGWPGERRTGGLSWTDVFVGRAD